MTCSCLNWRVMVIPWTIKWEYHYFKMFGNPLTKLKRSMKVFRFSDFHSNSVHINSHILLWLQIRWLVTFSLWWIVDFVYFFSVFKLIFGKSWKKLSRPKKVFRFFDFHFNSVHINTHVLLWLQIRWLITFSLWWIIVDFVYFFFFFLSSNWCLQAMKKAIEAQKGT